MSIPYPALRPPLCVNYEGTDCRLCSVGKTPHSHLKWGYCVHHQMFTFPSALQEAAAAARTWNHHQSSSAADIACCSEEFFSQTLKTQLMFHLFVECFPTWDTDQS